MDDATNAFLESEFSAALKRLHAQPASGASAAWNVIYAVMMIKLGGTLPTVLDSRIGRGIENGVATHPERPSWLATLLPDLSEANAAISDLFMLFLTRKRQLGPQSGIGYVVDCFKWTLHDRAKGAARLDPRPYDEIFGPGGEPEPASQDAEVGIDQRKVHADLVATLPAVLDRHPDLCKAAALYARTAKWETIARALGISNDSLLQKRRAWGLLDRSLAMQDGFHSTVIGRWIVEQGIPIDDDHVEHIHHAIGVFLAAALSVHDNRTRTNL